MENNYVAELSDVLLKQFRERKPEIFEKIKKFSKSDSNYRLLELSDELVVCINKNKEESKMHIGFPFPIYDLNERLETIETNEGVSANLFLRGEPVRAKQRKLLFELGGVKEFDTPNYIREKVQKDFQNAKNLVYVDPYDFIGDSFIGLYYPDVFSKEFRIKNDNVEVFTNSHEHLSAEYKVKPKNIEEIVESIRKNKYCIITDPLDNTWEFTYKLLKSLNCDANIMIPGRNIYVVRKNGKMNFYWYAKQDVLLRNSNIEDYMNETLLPFTEDTSVDCRKMVKNKGAVYINPFGSRKQKTIPLELAVGLVEKLKNKGLECMLIGGFPDNDEHREWISEFSEKIKDCKIKYYANLTEIKKDFEENKCSCVITTDTSITHLANRFGYPNISLYSGVLWDIKSVQSLASDSPLGFCRYIPYNIPALLRKNSSGTNLEKLAKNIVEGVLFFRESRYSSGDFKWAEELYAPSLLLKEVINSPCAERLIDASIKISPTHKLKELNEVLLVQNKKTYRQ